MKIAFACPTYGPMEAKVVHAQRHAIMMAWANGLEVHGDIWTDRQGWDHARNTIANAFVASEGLDGVLWCDSDIVMPPDAILQLARPEVDVMTAIYYGRLPPYEPQIHVYNEHADAWNRILKWPDNGAIFPVHGHGFGLVYTSRRALEATQQVEFTDNPIVRMDGSLVQLERKWWFRTGKWGEDLTWCAYARKMGLILWCNPNVVVGHLGSVEVIGRERFEEYYRDNKTEAHMAAMTLVGADGKYEAVAVPGLGETLGAKEHNVALSEELRMTPSA